MAIFFCMNPSCIFFRYSSHGPVWPNSENWVGKEAQQRKFIHPPKIKTTSNRQSCRFQINDQVTKAYLLKAIYEKRQQKRTLTPFLSGFSQQSGQNQDDFSYLDIQEWFSSQPCNRFLFKDRHLIFSYITHPYDVTILPTSYPVTENEFVHTATGRRVALRFVMPCRPFVKEDD